MQRNEPDDVIGITRRSRNANREAAIALPS